MNDSRLQHCDSKFVLILATAKIVERNARVISHDSFFIRLLSKWLG